MPPPGRAGRNHSNSRRGRGTGGSGDVEGCPSDPVWRPLFPGRSHTALRASVRQGCLKDFIDSRGAGGQAVAVAPVGLAGFAAGLLGLWLGRPLGEWCGLAFGLALSLVKAGAGLFEFALEAFVLLAKAFVLLAELLGLGAELLQPLKDGEGHGHRVEHLDGRHRCLVAARPARELLCESPAEKARGCRFQSDRVPLFRSSGDHLSGCSANRLRVVGMKGEETFSASRQG